MYLNGRLAVLNPRKLLLLGKVKLTPGLACLYCLAFPLPCLALPWIGFGPCRSAPFRFASFRCVSLLRLCVSSLTFTWSKKTEAGSVADNLHYTLLKVTQGGTSNFFDN